MVSCLSVVSDVSPMEGLDKAFVETVELFFSIRKGKKERDSNCQGKRKRLTGYFRSRKTE